MQNLFAMTTDERAAFEEFRDDLLAVLGQAVANERDRDIFRLRLERHFVDLYTPLRRLYADHPGFAAQIRLLGERLVQAFAGRATDLKLLDLEREMTPDWFQRPTMVGGIYYVDRFAGTLQGVRERLDYLCDLGLTYVHLMPLLQPRSGPNDGGYAVQEYRAVNPELGSVGDLVALAQDFHGHGISLCIDVVVNHTAREHEWARRALAGEPEYLDYYLTFPNRTLPDHYELTLPEVFPDFAPGNFTWYPAMAGAGRWVWTTFNEYQWDLNYTNPAVWGEMLDVLLYLANLGVDVLRLDAVPFMWKRLGTNSQNQPEVLDLLQAFRAAMRVVCPATICKAEAIVAPADLVQYLGVGERSGKLCEIAYHNSLMVLLWSALATKKADLFTHSLRTMPPHPATSAWITYVRCHDDIGWAISDENAEEIGESGYLHRQFLSAWYSGAFPTSFARGAVFQFNPLTNDRRISGMTASLAGLEIALEQQNSPLVDLAVRRISLLYSLIFAYGGIPLIYMGDELGLLNDSSYLADPTRAEDNRWLHRPAMDWNLAAQRHDQRTLAGRIWSGMRHLIDTRKRTAALHSAGSTTPIDTGNLHILGFVRSHASGRVVVLGNLADSPQHIGAETLWRAGLRGEIRDLLTPAEPAIALAHDRLLLQPYQSVWLSGSQGSQA
ncbi:MAG: alpha-amylase [Herpetosiphonaceae bacterium]|nr:alpha-amylase [Herpetosiphonaceae bacterium]